MVATTSSLKSITVSIVSHGQQALIVPLLEQLQAHSAASIAQVILTVNVMEPDLFSARTWAFPLMQLANASPKGFGANHNAAFNHCRTPWFLVLNPDMRFDTDVLAPLLALARNDTGLLAPRVMEPGKIHPEPHRALITPIEIVRRNRPNYLAPKRPSWVPGMFMLFRASAYREIGGFDSRYFMYGEDFDICARLRLAGWRMRVAENFRVLHQAQRASRRDLRHLGWHFTSLARVWMSAAFWRYRARRSELEALPPDQSRW